MRRKGIILLLLLGLLLLWAISFPQKVSSDPLPAYSEVKYCVYILPTNTPTPQPVNVNSFTCSEDHLDWTNAAGISPSDYCYVDYIVSHESGWSATKWNYSGSGAYGLGQALPASKMASYGSDYMTNPITQLKWASDYASSRYGGWYGAYLFWINHWYW